MLVLDDDDDNTLEDYSLAAAEPAAEPDEAVDEDAEPELDDVEGEATAEDVDFLPLLQALLQAHAAGGEGAAERLATLRRATRRAEAKLGRLRRRPDAADAAAAARAVLLEQEALLRKRKWEGGAV